jgi:hypothetical protein
MKEIITTARWELKLALMKKAKTKRDDPTHCRKIKTFFSITMPNFCSRKGIYQMRIFVYKIVKISKVEAITHTTLHDF